MEVGEEAMKARKLFPALYEEPPVSDEAEASRVVEILSDTKYDFTIERGQGFDRDAVILKIDGARLTKIDIEPVETLEKRIAKEIDQEMVRRHRNEIVERTLKPILNMKWER